MELPQRKGEDRFLPAGRYHWLQDRLLGNPQLRDVKSLVVSAFDMRTRMFPFIGVDWYALPCGPRSIAGALYDAGMTKTRFVYQLWNPKISPRRAELDGQPIDMLLVSSMQVHSAAAYKLMEDAWTLGDRRPLIITGGPKAIYEPFDFFGRGPNGQIGADVVVTGEEPVLLELLTVLSDFGAGPGRMREAFERARKAGALAQVAGLVYSADGSHDGRNLINTGVQRLIKDLDELPMPINGYRTLEAPHRRSTLSRETLPLAKGGSGWMITNLLLTRGCKYTCHYCGIPAYNQRTYRRKSPQRLAEEFRECRRQLGTRYIFGADDNFFNSREYVEQTLEALSRTELDGKPIGRLLRFGTEATVADSYKCRDLFPLSRKWHTGLDALWLGVEDLSASLVDKGQGPEIAKELFAAMLDQKITPMVMIMHHDAQPLYTRGSIAGLINQVRYLRKIGALSLQCTLANPIMGSRWMNDVLSNRMMFSRVGGVKVEDRYSDGNHILTVGQQSPWRMQLNHFLAYAAFYNLWNFVTAWRYKPSLRFKHMFYQIWGMWGLTNTAWRLKGYFLRLLRGPIERVEGWPDRHRRPGSPYAERLAAAEAQVKELNVTELPTLKSCAPKASVTTP